MDPRESLTTARRLAAPTSLMTREEYVNLGNFFRANGPEGWDELAALAELGILEKGLEPIRLGVLIDQLIPEEKIGGMIKGAIELATGAVPSGEDAWAQLLGPLDLEDLLIWMAKYDAVLDLVLMRLGLQPLPTAIPAPIKTFITLAVISLALNGVVGRIKNTDFLPTMPVRIAQDDLATLGVDHYRRLPR